MSVVPISKTALALSLCAFVAAWALEATGHAPVLQAREAQAWAIASFGCATAALALSMRTWMWRAGVAFGAIQCLAAVAYLLLHQGTAP